MMRRLLRLLSGVLAVLALLVVGYPLAAWVGSSIPESGSAAPPPPDAETVQIMVLTRFTRPHTRTRVSSTR